MGETFGCPTQMIDLLDLDPLVAVAMVMVFPLVGVVVVMMVGDPIFLFDVPSADVLSSYGYA